MAYKQQVMVSATWSNTTAGSTATRPSTTTSRPQTGSRWNPKTVGTSSTGSGNAEIICAISESRGISPTIGLSFVSLSTSEAILCQFTDTQTYARTCQKIKVFAPSEILYMSAAEDSKLIAIVVENLEVEAAGIAMTSLGRHFWSEPGGLDYVQCLAFPDDLEVLKLTTAGNYYATCCFSAVLKHMDMSRGLAFAPQTLRIKFEPSEGSMMIDLSTMASLELVQNLQNAKSRECLFGLLNETMTPMGARFLRSNVLQPSTDAEKIRKRQEAVAELASKGEILFAIRSALKSFVDADRVLAALVVISTRQDFHFMEQSANHVLMLKKFVDSINPIWRALSGASSDELQMICQLCEPANYVNIVNLITYCINEDVSYSIKPLELRSQRIFAIKQYKLNLDLKYDQGRQYYLRFPAADLDSSTALPAIFINTNKKKKYLECQTLDLMKMNQRIKDTNSDVITLSDSTIQELIQQVRSQIHQLFKISESIATLDMLAAFAHLTTTCISGEYIRPELSTNSLMVKCGRHPIRAKLMSATCEKFVPNDVYATPQNRFHIITGANMSGKSTYIRSIALMSIMAQIGCFVPAEYAAFPLSHELFARVSTDDNIDANVSTFASEMREIAFIIRNISHRSLVIIDELGRGTSTTDGLAIAIAIAETLINSKAYVWFVTHFRDLPRILADRTGVSNLHLSVDISEDYAKMTMRYKILEGYEEEKFYGLALARVIGLPPDVLDTATWVSKALHERNEAKKRNSRATAAARRTKLILNLREQLSQARESLLDGSSEDGVGAEALRDWLKKLQVEFLVRLRAIDSDAEMAAAGAAAEADEIGEEMSDVHDGDGDPERQMESDLFETGNVDV